MNNEINFENKNNLKKLLNDKKFRKIFFITGKNSFNLSGAKNIFQDIFFEKKVSFFFKKEFVPQFAELKFLIKEILNFKPDLIIGCGGGCVIDYAKMANIVNLEEKLKSKIINLSLKTKKKAKLLIIPTTAGSGAEVTSNAVIYINKIKYSIEDQNLIPDYFFLLPELVLKSSKKIKSSAGFDCLAQGIESLFAVKSTPESVKFSKKAIQIALNNFTNFVSKPNLSNSYKMQLAANFSGKAINISKTIFPHAISYPFTSHFNISHGHAVSLFFESCIKFNYLNMNKNHANFNLNERFKILFNLFKVKNINDFTKKINNLKKETNLDNNFINLGIDLKSYKNKIIDEVNPLRLGNNPIKIDSEVIKLILENENK
jgi:alcohol dehydrogenase class IV